MEACFEPVVESPGDSIIVPDRARLINTLRICMIQWGRNGFNIGGKSVKIINCVLALKSYSERKQDGANDSSKFSGNLRPSDFGKYFVRKNGEPFKNSLLRSQSINADQNLNGDLVHDEPETDTSLNILVRAALSDKKPEEVTTGRPPIHQVYRRKRGGNKRSKSSVGPVGPN
ncbi:hypothetical protein Scep_015128 [Stephania cephalantha]|uniref:Uncharacterized protein n=1 Tax=Stephania cephalantha TaxID=152367 RepID=A0AAP0J2C5_9MAGN